MSKGHGAVELAVLKVLRKHHVDIYWASGHMNGGSGLSLSQIVYLAVKPEGEPRWRNPAYRNATDSVRRALKSLDREGLLRSEVHWGPRRGLQWALKRWRPSAELKRQREEAERKRKADEAARAERWWRDGADPFNGNGVSGATTLKLVKLVALALQSPEAHEREAARLKAVAEYERLGKSWSELFR